MAFGDDMAATAVDDALGPYDILAGTARCPPFDYAFVQPVTELRRDQSDSTTPSHSHRRSLAHLVVHDTITGPHARSFPIASPGGSASSRRHNPLSRTHLPLQPTQQQQQQQQNQQQQQRAYSPIPSPGRTLRFKTPAQVVLTKFDVPKIVGSIVHTNTVPPPDVADDWLALPSLSAATADAARRGLREDALSLLARRAESAAHFDPANLADQTIRSDNSRIIDTPVSAVAAVAAEMYAPIPMDFDTPGLVNGSGSPMFYSKSAEKIHRIGINSSQRQSQHSQQHQQQQHELDLQGRPLNEQAPFAAFDAQTSTLGSVSGIPPLRTLDRNSRFDSFDSSHHHHHNHKHNHSQQRQQQHQKAQYGVYQSSPYHSVYDNLDASQRRRDQLLSYRGDTPDFYSTQPSQQQIHTGSYESRQTPDSIANLQHQPSHRAYAGQAISPFKLKVGLREGNSAQKRWV